MVVYDRIRENPTRGYTRIRGALANIGHEIARNMVRQILQEQGIEPSSERGRPMPRKTFLRAHWPGLAATDMFSAGALALTGLRRHIVLFVIELKKRPVKIADIYHQPYGECVEQMARNLSADFDGFLLHATYLIHDRDPLCTRAFDEILRSCGIKPIKLPPKSPNLNSYAERFVRSIKRECLNRVIPLGEDHLRLIVGQYVEHYHCEAA